MTKIVVSQMKKRAREKSSNTGFFLTSTQLDNHDMKWVLDAGLSVLGSYRNGQTQPTNSDVGKLCGKGVCEAILTSDKPF